MVCCESDDEARNITSAGHLIEADWYLDRLWFMRVGRLVWFGSHIYRAGQKCVLTGKVGRRRWAWHKWWRFGWISGNGGGGDAVSEGGGVMTGPRNYIEAIAFDVFRASGETGDMPECELALWVNYAVLVLTKGTDTTSADVHEAWSAWATVHHNGEHRSLIPFNQLTPEIQAYDDLYRDAIHQVASQMAEAA